MTGETRRQFTVALNPEAQTNLPFLVRLPLPDGELILKTRDIWPRTSRVYCHRLDSWPDDVEIVEEVPVRFCGRRGVAIDLVLDRSRDFRSQIVFTRLRSGREGIFWQSQKTAAASRPGVRLPKKRASLQDSLSILVDTRETYAWKFSSQQATTERRALPIGDYGVELDGALVGVVERKSLADLSGSMVSGKLGFVMAELALLRRAAVAVEDRYSAVFKLQHVSQAFVAELLAALQIRYPNVPIVFCDNRKLAEEWTFRFLGAALSYAQAEQEQP
jgi:hypothetical protein